MTEKIKDETSIQPDWSKIETMFSLEGLTITDDIIQSIAKIDAFKGRWNALAKHSPKYLIAIASSEITESKVDRPDFLYQIGLKGCQPITRDLLCKLNGQVTAKDEVGKEQAGQYKTRNNNFCYYNEDKTIREIVWKAPPPKISEKLMEKMLDWYNAETKAKTIHPLIAFGIFQGAFLSIHPFRDGNGRITRFLLSLSLTQSGYGYAPYCPLTKIIWETKKKLHKAMRKTDLSIWGDEPNWNPIVEYFLSVLLTQMELLEEQMNKMVDKIGFLNETDAVIYHYIATSKHNNLRSISKKCDIPINELQNTIDSLKEQRLIKRHMIPFLGYTAMK